MRKKPARETDIRKDILKALDRAFPDGIVLDNTDPDKNPMEELYREIRGELSRIEGAAVLYERDPSGFDDGNMESAGDSESDWEHEEPPYTDLSSSYHLLFLGITDPKLQFGTESPSVGEGSEDITVEGQGSIGCCVAVSLLAPVAAVRVATLEVFEDGSHTCPDIEPYIFNVTGEPADMDDHVREMFGENGVRAVHRLRDQIAEVLQSRHVPVLPDEELRKPVPWLRAGEEAIVGEESLGRGITVQDAFFHRGP